jgi:hypothetical protein
LLLDVTESYGGDVDVIDADWSADVELVLDAVDDDEVDGAVDVVG